MREIKFRAWDKNGKEMFVWSFTEQGLEPKDFFNHINYQVMQYTGLKDKNGKEIYLNDLLSFKRKEKEIVEVTWRDDGFKCGIKTSDNCTTWYGLNNFLEKYQCEIIGDIYETPELLKDIIN